MDKRFLEDCLGRGMSLVQIGQRAGRDPSTVGYWVRKHGLRAVNAERNAPRGGLTKDQLEPLVNEGLTLAEMAERLDRSIRTICYWMDKHRLRPAGGRRIAADRAAKAAGLTRIRKRCRHHGEADFVLEGRGYYRCLKCRAAAVARRRRVVKQHLIREAGGACVLCGYERCPAALQFHHVDPQDKSFHLSRHGVSRSLARSQEEAKKCVLLCANCHAEIEIGFAKLPHGLTQGSRGGNSGLLAA
jgi:hypothetical protein